MGLPVSSAAESRAQDAEAARRGVSVAALMEVAGAAVARVAERVMPPGATVAVLFGAGHNGGDALVAGRHLARRHRVTLLNVGHPPRFAEAAALLRAAQSYGAMLEPGERLAEVLGASDWVVDGILGTGVSRPLDDAVAAALALVRQSGKPVLAVDLPSGVDSDTGAAWGELAPATVTVVLGQPKRGHFAYPGAGLSGTLWVADIGLPPLPTQAELVSPAEAAAALPPWDPNRHKQGRGRLLVVGGSPTMVGAAVMAAEAGLRAGAGVVELMVPRPVVERVRVSPAVMVVPAAATAGGALALGEREVGYLARADAVVFGPGISTQAGAGNLRLVLERARRVLVDADGLNLWAGLGPPAVPPANGAARVALTPHAGEAGRLLRVSPAAIEADRFGQVLRLAQAYGASVLLKGPYTLVAGAAGTIGINPTGGAELATAGSGDVLSGIAGSLMAQGLEPAAALATAAYLHGWAGRVAAERVGRRSVTAPDLVEALGEAYRRVEAEVVPAQWPQTAE